MKKNIFMLVSLVIFIQAAAGGLRINIDPKVKDVFMKVVTLGYHDAVKALRDQRQKQNLVAKSIQFAEAYQMLDGDGPAAEVLFFMVPDLNNKKKIIESYTRAGCLTVGKSHEFWSRYLQTVDEQLARSLTVGKPHEYWLRYLQTVDEQLACIQKTMVPQFDNTVLVKDPYLRTQIKELILSNQTVVFSGNLLRCLKATELGKLAAMQAVYEDHPVAFDSIWDGYIN